MDKLLEVNDIMVSYGTKTVLKNVSFTLWENDFLGMIGPNGGGKTTLLKAILGLLKPSAGHIIFYRGGQPVPALKIGYLPQINQIDKVFPIAVYEVVASGLMAENKGWRKYSKAQHLRINETLDRMEIKEKAKCPVGELSGGELQRVLLGRAIVSHPEILILDEPNTYVDKFFESRLYQLLEEINKDMAIILVSHDTGAILPLVKNITCVNETLHYHAGNNPVEEWIEQVYHCPIELIGHGDFPHRVLKRHE
ncbi:MAG: metal ABC transporter ATP-binding protein [Tannerella sp.]|jgi:zinc transport system ATP-binding protein|nr:metal ABC transporter ATP-binding protein [Tannerella sp.]